MPRDDEDEAPVVVDAAEVEASLSRSDKRKKRSRDIPADVDEATAAQMSAEDAEKAERKRKRKEERRAAAAASASGDAAAAAAPADGSSATASLLLDASAAVRGPVAVVTDEEIAAANPKQVRHEVSIPAGYPYVPLVDATLPSAPAREYPFVLDPFQRWSIAAIERNESVLVSAHTSAGKTVIAEYAIAVSLRNKQRVIYTSPIKALSNQKYRELQAEFSDVGLMTGDVSINPSASCLVMTTEILRNMLYRGSEVMREVAWVVFDEIHYMRDKERGVVWEESIIMLPKTVHHVFLSATIPNAKEFADWICRVHGQPCHVVYTDYRPTPLQHYLFPSGSDGIYLAVDEKSRLREDNFAKAMALVADAPAKGQRGKGGQKGGNKGGAGGSDIYKIIKMTLERQYQPVIVFAFSKRECEGLGLQMAKLDFNTDSEKAMVEQVFQNAVDSLSDDDKALPQIEHILPILKRGIGIHHGGLLPILKEVIEILFQEGLLKVLFATETFSMGLNMPARTVVFTSVRKFDGKDFRWVSSGEYTQMAGRAGRRGLDDRGIVIQMLDEKIEPDVCRAMLTGGADNLTSAFHLSYNMILNLLRVEDVSPEYLLDRSFFQFQNNASVPALEKQLLDAESRRDALVIREEESISDYYLAKQQLDRYQDDVRAVLRHPSFSLPFMQPGRLVRIRDGPSRDFGWGVVVNFQKRVPAADKRQQRQQRDSGKDGKDDDAEPLKYILDVLLYCKAPATGSGSAGANSSVEPCTDATGEMVVVPVALTTLMSISSVRIHVGKDLVPKEARAAVHKTVKEVERRFPEGLPTLDPIEDMGVQDEAFAKLMEKVTNLERRLAENRLSSHPDLSSLYEAYAAKAQLHDTVKAIKKSIKAATSIMHMDELKSRKRVLRRLGYTTSNDVIEMKGRVACEISTGDELMLTEMIFNGVFNDLTVEQTTALLSCFVFDEKADENLRLREELDTPFQALRETARRIAKIANECKLQYDEEAYVKSFKGEMMEVVYQWTLGAKFAQVLKMTDVFEGSIIRCIKRLEELLRQMADAAKAIGNTELEKKFNEGVTKIKRDIVFAASLYL